MSVISNAELDLQQSISVADVLQEAPGLIVVQPGGLGQSATTISIRGAEAGQTLVLIDGVRINDPSTVDNEPIHKLATEPLLQHYGIETRWLDVVDSVPHALFFATHQLVASPRGGNRR